MKLVPIKELKNKQGQTIYTVSALPFETKNGTKRKIPHPLGTDTIEFSSLEEAKSAIKLAGFDCILPDGIKITNDINCSESSDSYDQKVLDALLKETQNSNPCIVAAAVNALSEIKHPDCINVFLDKIGEENEQIRENAINALVKHGTNALPEIYKSLKSENWVKRNSAITCLKRLQETPDIPIGEIIEVLLSMLTDTNPIVKCSTISALGDFYKLYKKSMSI